jgi:ribosome-binding factor A
MTSFRKERMGEAIRKVVSEKLSRERGLIENAFITVSRVDLSADLGVAKVFYSVFGDGVDMATADEVMKEHCGEFRYEVSQKLKLRHTPKIEFCFDKNAEYASRVHQILAEAESE